MADDSTQPEIRVLVTSFGPFLDITLNPSSQITSLLPSSLPSTTITPPITLLTPPPLYCAYHTLLPTAHSLLETPSPSPTSSTTTASTQPPDLVLHIGLAAERNYFAIEKGAERDGYHEFLDVDRRVFARGENKVIWGKSASRLDSSFDLEEILARWKMNMKTGEGNSHGTGKGKGKGNGKGGMNEVDLRTSDDVGNFVCGFLYYTTLEWFQKRGLEKRVLFLHVPLLETVEEVKRGRDVVVALIRGMVGSLVESREG